MLCASRGRRSSRVMGGWYPGGMGGRTLARLQQTMPHDFALNGAACLCAQPGISLEFAASTGAWSPQGLKGARIMTGRTRAWRC
eukprot:4110-Eustigmatos_ZCMA.PRE.1